MAKIGHKFSLDEVVQWLDDLGMSNRDQSLNTNNLNLLFHNKKLVNLWSYLMKNVRSEDVASEIHKNITLHQLRRENESLNQSCSSKVNELAMEKVKLQKLEEQVKQKQIKCCQTTLSSLHAQSNIDSNLLKSICNEQHIAHLAVRKNLLKDKQSELEDLSTTQVADNQPVCSSINKNQAVHSCSSVLKQQTTLIVGQFRKGFRNESSNTHVDLWEIALNILKSYQPSVIKEALCFITKQSTGKLGETATSDIEMNTELEYEESPIDMIEAMMQEHHLESKKEYERAVANELKAAKLSEASEKLLKQLCDRLSEHNQPAWNAIEAELSLKSEEAFLQSLHSSVKRLQEQLDDSDKVQNDLAEMQREVKDFNKQLARNKIEIVETTRQISDFRQKLPLFQKETLSSAGQLLHAKQTKLKSLCSTLRNAIDDERRALDVADVTKLQTLEIDKRKVPVGSLSIYRPLNSGYEYGNSSYQNIVSLFGLDVISSPVDFYRDVLRRINENKFDESVGNLFKSLLQREAVTVKSVEKLTREATSSRKQHAESIFQRMSRAERSVQVLESGEKKLGAVLNDWYEQPAQYQAPWLRVDGLQLKKWKEMKLSS